MYAVTHFDKGRYIHSDMIRQVDRKTFHRKGVQTGDEHSITVLDRQGETCQFNPDLGFDLFG